MHVIATDVLQTGRETIDAEPIVAEEVDWRDVLDEAGNEQPASAALRDQMFNRDDGSAADDLRTAIEASGNVSMLARMAKVGRQTIYDFLAGGALHSRSRRHASARRTERRGNDPRRGASAFSLNEIAAATGLSLAACSRIRAGTREPHPRHWESPRELADS